MADILLLTPQLPYPPQQGTSLRNYHIICGLAQTHRVSLLTYIEDNQSEAAADIAPLLEKCDRIETVPVPSRTLAKRLWQLATTRQPDMAHRLASPLFAVKLRALLAERPFHIVQIEGIELARYIPIIREASPQSKIVFDDHNAETELQHRNFLTDRRIPKRFPAAVYSWIQVQRLRRFERWACIEADGVTAVSEADARILANLISDQYSVISDQYSVESESASQQVSSQQKDTQLPNYPITQLPNLPISQSPTTPITNYQLPISIPNSIDTHAYQSPVDPIPFDLIFAGKMDYRPNVDAVLWFAEVVWPLIVAKRPFTTWAIVGQKPHQRLDTLKGNQNITITGFVDSMLPYWQGAKVAIMPFRIGSGTRLKIIEAMATGTPIVSTPVGAEGFPATSGKELILAESAEEMATAVLSLLDNPEKQDALRQAGFEFVQQYDWRQVVRRFEALYEEIGVIG